MRDKEISSDGGRGVGWQLDDHEVTLVGLCTQSTKPAPNICATAAICIIPYRASRASSRLVPVWLYLTLLPPPRAIPLHKSMWYPMLNRGGHASDLRFVCLPSVPPALVSPNADCDKEKTITTGRDDSACMHACMHACSRGSGSGSPSPSQCVTRSRSTRIATGATDTSCKAATEQPLPDRHHQKGDAGTKALPHCAGAHRNMARRASGMPPDREGCGI